MPKRGGRRPGAGRPKGSANKKSAEIRERAAREGITPLEVMLNTMEALWKQATAGKVLNFEMALAACNVGKDAAPYMHPRMQQITAQVDQTNREVSPNASAHNLSVIEKARKAG